MEAAFDVVDRDLEGGREEFLQPERVSVLLLEARGLRGPLARMRLPYLDQDEPDAVAEPLVQHLQAVA